MTVKTIFMKTVTKVTNPYWECKRCNINSLTLDRMVPCPRGSCEAKLAGEMVTTVTVIKRLIPKTKSNGSDTTDK